MADRKVSELTALAAAPATDDELYIRDISVAQADESKRILVSNLLLALTNFAALAISPAGSDELLINDGGVIKKITADDLMFGDAGTPTTQAFSDSAVKGTAIEASRIDHKHGMPAASGGGFAPFGDGDDGDVTISGNTDLSRDMFYNDLTVDNTFTLFTKGYRVFVKGTLTNNGTIENNGINGSSAASGTLAGSGAGGGSSGVAGASVNPSLGGAGGASSDAGGGLVTAPSTTDDPLHTYPTIMLLRESIALGATKILGGAGGGGSGGSAYGGGGGGLIVIAAKTIDNSGGTIIATGGLCVQAQNPGGGGGGVIVLIYNSLTTGTESVAGGAGFGTGSAGSSGSLIKLGP